MHNAPLNVLLSAWLAKHESLTRCNKLRSHETRTGNCLARSPLLICFERTSYNPLPSNTRTCRYAKVERRINGSSYDFPPFTVFRGHLTHCNSSERDLIILLSMMRPLSFPQLQRKRTNLWAIFSGDDHSPPLSKF